MLPHHERVRRETARSLQGAALRLVGQRGFSSVTVDDIAAEAGVSRRTFFNYYPTKAAALFDPDPDDADRLAALLAEVQQTTPPWQALRRACTAFVGGHEEVIAVRRRLIAQDPELDRYHRTAHHHVESALEAWAARARPDDPYLALLMANTAGTILATSFLAWEADQDPDALVQLVDRGFSLVATTFE
jgi:AcrR family transcriptional regulator